MSSKTGNSKEEPLHVSDLTGFDLIGVPMPKDHWGRPVATVGLKKQDFPEVDPEYCDFDAMLYATTYGVLTRTTLRFVVWAGYRLIKFQVQKTLGSKPTSPLTADGDKTPESVVVQEVARKGANVGFHAAAELALGLIWRPPQYLTSKSAPRLMMEFIFPKIGRLVSKLDGFDPLLFVQYSEPSLLSHSSKGNFVFAEWQLPYYVLTLGKMMYARWRTGSFSSLKLPIVVPLLAGQVLAKNIISTYAVSLPTSKADVLAVIGIIAFDMMAEEFIMDALSPFRQPVRR